MFTYRHVGYGICFLRISLGRDKIAPFIHHLISFQAIIYIQTVSRYILLHIIVLIVYSVS